MLTFRKSRTHARVETHEDTNHQLIVEASSQIRGLYPVDVAVRVLSLARHGGFVPLEEATIRETMMVNIYSASKTSNTNIITYISLRSMAAYIFRSNTIHRPSLQHDPIDNSTIGIPAFKPPAHKHAHHLHSIPPREKSTRTALIIDHILWVHGTLHLYVSTFGCSNSTQGERALPRLELSLA